MIHVKASEDLKPRLLWQKGKFLECKSESGGAATNHVYRSQCFADLPPASFDAIDTVSAPRLPTIPDIDRPRACRSAEAPLPSLRTTHRQLAADEIRALGKALAR